MPCFHPLACWQLSDGSINFSDKFAKPNQSRKPFQVPCGQCMGCRIDKKRQWATRIVHESSLYKQNSFITLTYDEQHIPPTGTLVKEHFQKFIKALRDYNPHKTIRYFHCGEYGEQSFRPHYHAILFNHDFPDKVKLDYKGNLYTSEQLSKHWTEYKDNPKKLPRGYVTTGDVTLESAAYVAGYVQKKVNGRQQEQHYRRFKDLDRKTGELIQPYQLEPEYATMSRRPGIAHDWFKKYHKDTYKDFITINGKKQKIPKYYDTKLYEMHPELADAIKAKRKELALSRADDFTPERLLVIEACMKDRMSKFKRKL